MDGRIQLPLLRFIQDRYEVRYIDIITEPGPIQYLAGHMNHSVLETIRKRLRISVDVHGSEVIAISGHYDCAGNPVAKREQWRQMDASVGRRPGLGFRDPTDHQALGRRELASEGRPLARPPIAEVRCGRGPHPVRRASSAGPG